MLPSTNVPVQSIFHEFLLASEALEPGFPKDISVETTQHWLHELRCKVLSSKKDVCYGHEREDVA